MIKKTKREKTIRVSKLTTHVSEMQRSRLIFLRILLLVAFTTLGYRVLDLQLFNKHFLQNEGDKRSVRYETVAAHRGIIFDRHGKPLSVSTPLVTICADPRELYGDNTRWVQLAEALGLDDKKLSDRITINKHKEFLYLKRKMTPEEAARVMALDVLGVYTIVEHQRYYPAGEVTSHVVGIVNMDEQGQEGIELAYDNWLSGRDGKVRHLKDRKGRLTKESELVQSPQAGRELRLSIDLRLQYLGYRALQKATKKHGAKSGSLVMLDSKTGEVLVMVNQPSYNPNNRSVMKPSHLRNRTVVDALEPGSTLKPFTVTAALESGYYTKTTPVNTNPGWIIVGHDEVRDIRNYGQLDITSLLIKSSNVGAAKVAMDIGIDSLLDIYGRVGLGQGTGLGFPGENAGYLPFKDSWSDISIAALSFGYGVTVTPLQLAQAYMILANRGIKRPISLVKRELPPEGGRVISKEIADDIIDMLVAVTEKGSGRRAKIPGYKIAGKTGTVRKLGVDGYKKDKHVGLFVGIAPAYNPRLVTVVVIDEPEGKEYYGGLVAAPVFAQVNADALRILSIPPDKPDIYTVQTDKTKKNDAG